MTNCRFEKNSYPSSTTWCARHIKSISCFWRKRDTTSGPNVKETPRSFSLQPVISLSGSDHRRSQRSPQSGIYCNELSASLALKPWELKQLTVAENACPISIPRVSRVRETTARRANRAQKKIVKRRKLTSVGRITRRICSMELRSGLKPPCMVKIFSSMMAAMGRQLKQSVKVFHSLMLYRRLHSS